VKGENNKKRKGLLVKNTPKGMENKQGVNGEGKPIKRGYKLQWIQGVNLEDLPFRWQTGSKGPFFFETFSKVIGKKKRKSRS